MVLILTGQAGCHHRMTIPSEKASSPSGPEDYSVYIERLVEREKAVFSLDGFFRVQASKEKVTKRARGAFIFKRPGYIYLEFISPLGATKVVAGVDDREIVIYYPGEKEYFEGEATAENMERIFGFRLLPEEILTIFSGQFIDFEKYETVSFQNDSLRKAIRGDTVSRDGRKEAGFWMMPATGWLFSGFLTEKNHPQRELRIHYGDFQKIESYDFPTKISIDKKESPWRVTFKGKDIRVNGIRDTERFTLTPPHGGVLIPLERLDPEEPLFFGEEDDEGS